MSRKESSWKYADDVVVDRPGVVAARAHSIELGVRAVSPAIGSQLAVIAAATGATSIVEVGTGVGVSALYFLDGSPEATITSIDTEAEHQQIARAALLEAGAAPNRIRLITGKAADVLPRLNDDAYDLVLLDADPASIIDYVEHALRIVRSGGVVLIPHALWEDRVADPASRGDIESDFRMLAGEMAASAVVVSAVSPAGDGLLQVVKRPPAQ
ncbi:class I SAM-dependent methyltransferase [Cnuibacter physcomitrellae]|uniref:O-methyltransferase n=1 Tax=Cnuibacter physcomitrellae TaxID=1619308 RepID=UPI00217574FC|nr:class I SAM-dependent methyltransferase [Cnuibacter physcomitrellae]MCS5496588.1 class I SAM-dependent methyltransferase [Cnuibacter physcomitrellae]